MSSSPQINDIPQPRSLLRSESLPPPLIAGGGGNEPPGSLHGRRRSGSCPTRVEPGCRTSLEDASHAGKTEPETVVEEPIGNEALVVIFPFVVQLAGTMIHVLYNATTYLFGLAESYAPRVPVLWDTAQTKGRPAIASSSSLTVSSPQSSSSHARPLVLRLTRGSHGGPIPTGPGRNRERGNYTPEIPETHQPSDYTIRTDVNAYGANFGLFDTNDPIQEFSDGLPYYGNQENIFRIDTAMYAPPAGWSSAPAILNESLPSPPEQSPALGTFIPDWDPRVGGSRPALPSNGLNAHHVDPLPPQAFNTYDDYFYPQPDPSTIAVDVPTSTGYLDGSNSGGTSKRIRGETKCPSYGRAS